MKNLKIILGLFILLILTVSTMYAQQQFVHTVINKYCNSTCSLIDNPALNNNPNAIIIITPMLVNGIYPNKPLVGAYYSTDQKKWSVHNAENVTIADGAKFNVQYWANPTANQFVYVIPAVGVTPCINHPVLNNNSKAQILFSITGSPRGEYFNKEVVEIKYNATALKWCVANVNSTPVKSDTAYSIVITNDGLRMTDLTKLANKDPVGTVKTPADIKPLDPACNCPTSLPPNGNAGGDLSGTYPNPTVKQIMGRPISNAVPKVGQILKWKDGEWQYAEDDVANPVATPPPAVVTKPSVLFHKQTATFEMPDPNIKTANLPGLDNQTFTLAQSSRVVYHTTVSVMNINTGNYIDAGIHVTLMVEILNASNTVISESTSEALLKVFAPHTLNSVGLAILPAGTYHTRVTIIRDAKNNGPIIVYKSGAYKGSQGGQMILEVYPD